MNLHEDAAAFLAKAREAVPPEYVTLTFQTGSAVDAKTTVDVSLFQADAAKLGYEARGADTATLLYQGQLKTLRPDALKPGVAAAYEGGYLILEPYQDTRHSQLKTQLGELILLRYTSVL